MTSSIYNLPFRVKFLGPSGIACNDSADICADDVVESQNIITNVLHVCDMWNTLCGTDLKMNVALIFSKTATQWNSVPSNNQIRQKSGKNRKRLL